MAAFSRRACPPRLPGENRGGQARRLNGVVLIGGFLVGCCTCPPPATPPLAYHGPTDPIGAVVRQVNGLAERVPSLWTQLDYSASLVDAHGRRTDVTGDGTLMYRRPASLLLSGDKDVAGQVFQLGCDGDQFWAKFRTGVGSADYYWGHVANLGKPGCEPVPVRPDLVTQVLGVGLLQTDLLAEPTPVMRFDNSADAYVFDFNARRPDRWVTEKEVWYDRRSADPVRVVLYDDAGRAVVRAELSRHEPFDAPGVPPARRPVVARHYELGFPDSGSTLSLDLNDPELSHHAKRLTFPNAGTFDRQNHPPDEHDRVVQVDENVSG